MNESTSAQQIEAMRRRVATLYRNASVRPQQHELLPEAFEELQVALEELQAMQDELQRQHQHLLDTREHIEAEHQTYQDLFVHAPIAYLISSLDGTIRKANYAAATLFQTNEKFMVGRSLALFVPDGERRMFRDQLAQARECDDVQIWEAHMQPWQRTPFTAMLTTAVAHGRLGHPIAIRWIVQDVTIQRPTESQLRTRIMELERTVRELTEQRQAAEQYMRASGSTERAVSG